MTSCVIMMTWNHDDLCNNDDLPPWSTWWRGLERRCLCRTESHPENMVSSFPIIVISVFFVIVIVILISIIKAGHKPVLSQPQWRQGNEKRLKEELGCQPRMALRLLLMRLMVMMLLIMLTMLLIMLKMIMSLLVSQSRVILIKNIWFLQLLHGFKMFHFVPWFQNSFCFCSTTIPSAVRKYFGLKWEFQWENSQKLFFCKGKGKGWMLDLCATLLASPYEC